MTSRFEALPALMAAAVVGATIPTVLPIFGGHGGWWLTAAVALPALLMSGIHLARPARWSGSPRVLLAAGIAALVALMAVMPPGPTGQPALGGLRDGFAQLLTSALPAPAEGPELGAAALVLGVASAAAVQLVLARRRSALALAPPATVYVAALLVGAGGLPAPRWGALAVVGAAAVYAVVLDQSSVAVDPARLQAGRAPRVAGTSAKGRGIHTGSLLAAAALLVVVMALAEPIAARLPGGGSRQPYDLRAALSPAPHPQGQVSLLASYAAMYDGPIRSELAVDAPGVDPTSLYWRLATFDEYRGVSWESSAVFQRAGIELPAGPHLSVSTETVDAEMTLLAPTTYLPLPGQPTTTSVAGLDVATTEGELVVPQGVRLPAHVRLASDVARPTRTQLLSAAAVGGTGDPGSPPLPPQLYSIADGLMARAEPDAFSRLTAISDYLTGGQFTLAPAGSSPIGSGAYQVLQLLTQTHTGSSEQYAAAFALLARAAGFRSRLAVGYLGGQRQTDGAVVFTSRDLTVWPEVDLDGIGWTAFPADPRSNGASRAPATMPASALGQALSQQERVNATGRPPVARPGAGGRPARTRSGTGQPGGGLPLGLWLALALVAAAAASLIAVLSAKVWRRRRRRGQTDPARRVIGAWDHVLDRLAEMGLALGPSLTGDEVADRSGRALGASCQAPITRLVPIVDGTRYDRRHPPTAAAAADAWVAVAEFDRALGDSVSLKRRAWAHLSLAPWRRMTGESTRRRLRVGRALSRRRLGIQP